MRASKSLNDVVAAQTEYFKEVQTQVTALNAENVSNLKGLRDSATEFVSGAFNKSAEEKAPKAAAKKKAA